MAARVAWLLRVNRVLSSNQEWARASVFAAAFRGGSYPKGASESTISRWETARGRASYLTIRRYEELLELSPGQLIAIADTIYRYAAPAAAGPPVLSRGEAPPAGSPAQARLEEMLERALSSEPMSGWHWDELTGQISTMPSLLIVPSRFWFDVATRLLEEMIVADGLPWMQRFEAFNRLLGHPTGQQAAVAACVSLVGDPANQVFIEPVSVLDGSAHPDANRFVLGQLTRPTNERTRYGALLACVRKVRYGHFTQAQLSGLVPAVSELLQNPESFADAAALGVELLRRMPAGLRTGAETGLRRALADDRHLHDVLSAGRLAARSTSAVVVRRIVAAAAAELSRHAPGLTDNLLPVLVDEMLYAPVLDVRLYASMLIRATPYAPAVAGALGAELNRPAVDGTLAASLLWGVRVIGGVDQRPIVERLILAPGVSPEVSEAAAQTIGHVGGASSDHFYLSAISQHSRSWRSHRARHSAAALTSLVYALGIAQNLRLLARVREDAEAPAPVRAAAGWWLSRPTRVYASARR